MFVVVAFCGLDVLFDGGVERNPGRLGSTIVVREIPTRQARCAIQPYFFSRSTTACFLLPPFTSHSVTIYSSDQVGTVVLIQFSGKPRPYQKQKQLTSSFRCVRHLPPYIHILQRILWLLSRVQMRSLAYNLLLNFAVLRNEKGLNQF